MFQQTKAYIEAKINARPRIGVVLGSGLGAFADELSDSTQIPYADIPGWPRSTAVGHAGKLVFGKLGSTDVVVMSGRAHLYEGYSPARVTYGVRIFQMLGVRSLVLTNAAGGVNVSFQQGGLVLISDHINLQGVNPLVGANEDGFGPRFPDMSEAYSREYRKIAKDTAAELGVVIDLAVEHDPRS